MNLKNKKIVFCLTGSFCTFKNTIIQMKELVKSGANIIPIMSYNAYNTDSKFGNCRHTCTYGGEVAFKKRQSASNSPVNR